MRLPGKGVLLRVIGEPRSAFMVCSTASVALGNGSEVVSVSTFRGRVTLTSVPRERSGPVIHHFSCSGLGRSVLLPTCCLLTGGANGPVRYFMSVIASGIGCSGYLPNRGIIGVDSLSFVFSGKGFGVSRLRSIGLSECETCSEMSKTTIVVTISRGAVTVNCALSGSSCLIPTRLCTLGPRGKVSIGCLTTGLLSGRLRARVYVLTCNSSVPDSALYILTPG